MLVHGLILFPRDAVQSAPRHAETPARRTRPSIRRRGAALVEFALVCMMLMTVILASIDFLFAVFTGSLVRYAVSEGIRFGITGKRLSGMSHADSIKEVVKNNSFGLLRSSDDAATIKVRYYLPDGSAETTEVVGNNLLEVAVENYQLKRLAPLIWPGGIFVTRMLVDVLEPFPGSGSESEEEGCTASS